MKKFFLFLFIFSSSLITSFDGRHILSDDDYRCIMVKLYGVEGLILIFKEEIDKEIHSKECKKMKRDKKKREHEKKELQAIKDSVSEKTSKEILKIIRSYFERDAKRFSHEIKIITEILS